MHSFESLFEPIKLLESQGAPTLCVVIDTEEEFDWSLPHNRESIATTAIREVGRVQDVFDHHGLKPCYVIDYPIALNQADNETLRGIHSDGRCVVGAHLHPWVTPPHDEEVNPYNSFPGNLPPELEFRKLQTLTETIKQNFGHQPFCYKAGRYGVGPGTTNSLYELGFRIDLSVTPGFDYSPEHGPDYSGAPNLPFLFGPNNAMFELPCTGGFAGALAHYGASLYTAVHSPLLKVLKVPGILARARCLERIRLSPEGFTLEEMKRITRYLWRRGVRHFTLSFHSPSVMEGLTPYVRDVEDRQAFIRRIEDYLVFFADEMHGEMTDPESLSRRLRSH